MRKARRPYLKGCNHRQHGLMLRCHVACRFPERWDVLLCVARDVGIDGMGFTEAWLALDLFSVSTAKLPWGDGI